MLLPSTHAAALLLLLVSFVCLGSWINLLKAGGPRWRFELFYLDFTIGALVFSVLIAWTLGTLGSELSFSDRVAVAGLRSQAMALGGGAIFGLGNMLLLATVALVGVSSAFPAVVSISLIVWSFTALHGLSYPVFIAAILLLLLAAVLALSGKRAAPVQQSSLAKRNQTAPPVSRKMKGSITGVLGGILIGVAFPLSNGAFWGDLGLGAYAGLLMFSCGIALSTLLFNFFFMKMAVLGPSVSLADYVAGGIRAHAAGVVGGMVWAAGMLGWMLAQSVPATEQPGYPSVTLWTEASTLLAFLWGILVWGEFRNVPSKSRTLLLASALAFAGGLFAFAYRFQS